MAKKSGIRLEERVGCCCDAAASYVTFTHLVSCAKLHHEDNGEPLSKLFFNRLDFWCIFVMHNSMIVKKKKSASVWLSFSLILISLSLGMLKTSIATTEPWCLGHTVHPSLTTGGSFQEVRITIGTFQHVQLDVKAELFLLTQKQIGHKFHSHFVHAQIIAWAEPSLIPISLEISWTVSWWPSMIKLRTFSMTSGFQLIRYCPTGVLVTLNWCSAIFKTGIPLFYLCNPIASLPKACWILQIVSLWVSPKLLAKFDVVALFNAFHHCVQC